MASGGSFEGGRPSRVSGCVGGLPGGFGLPGCCPRSSVARSPVIVGLPISYGGHSARVENVEPPNRLWRALQASRPMRRLRRKSAASKSCIFLPIAPLVPAPPSGKVRGAGRPAPRKPAPWTPSWTRSAPPNPSELTYVLTFLHRSPDLRLGALDRHHAGRRHRVWSRCRSRSIPTSRRRRSRSRPTTRGQRPVVADTVAAPIEQQVNGVENMLYMSSQCTNDGTYTLTVTFKHGVDLNMAQVLVQNRESLAEPILPDLVKRRGVTVKKKSPSDPDDRQPVLARRQPRQPLPEQLRHDPAPRRAGPAARRRRHHLHRPARLQHAGLARPGEDVLPQPDGHRRRRRPIAQQNVQVAAGQIGQPPVPSGQVFQYTMSTLGRLIDAEQFANMILKTDADGRDRPAQRRRPTSSWAPRATTRPARSTASPRWPCRSTSCPAPTR